MKAWVVGPLLGAALSGCAHALCVPAGIDFAPSYETTPCPESWTLEGVTCGVLHTVATEGDPQACRVDVAVADLAPTGTPVDDVPAVLLPGGPGQVVLFDLERMLPVFAPWRQVRPVWLVDPRGGGFSSPRLDCADPGSRKAMRRAKGADAASAFAACATSLRSQGLDLDAFRTDRLADDVATLAAVRGQAQLHVVGGSYGTRWAQTLLQRHPEVVRSVLLDAPVPWSMPLYEDGPRVFLDVLDTVFSACEADAACHGLLPDPWTTFWDTQRAWDGAPRQVRLSGRDVPLDGRALVAMVFDAVKSSVSMPAVPAILAAAAADRTDQLARLLALRGPQGVVPLLHHVISCADAFPNQRADRAAQAYDARLPGFDAFGEQSRMCAALGITPSGPEVQQVPPNDRPSLLVAGALDPMLPPLQVLELVANWPRAQVWIDPSSAHGVLRSSCGGEVGRAFLADPEGFAGVPCQADAALTLVTDLEAWLGQREADRRAD